LSTVYVDELSFRQKFYNPFFKFYIGDVLTPKHPLVAALLLNEGIESVKGCPLLSGSGVWEIFWIF